MFNCSGIILYLYIKSLVYQEVEERPLAKYHSSLELKLLENVVFHFTIQVQLFHFLSVLQTGLQRALLFTSPHVHEGAFLWAHPWGAYAHSVAFRFYLLLVLPIAKCK